jgi:hypothetical protein
MVNNMDLSAFNMVDRGAGSSHISPREKTSTVFDEVKLSDSEWIKEHIAPISTQSSPRSS